MVSWLPWRGDSSSTASFEKTLSSLSSKINASQARLDRLRASSRRVKALATLYLSFAYLVFAIVAFLVIGAKDLGQLEWAGVVLGPFLVFGVRKILAAFYNYRIESLSARLKDQQGERAKTIQKLKDATKYDSTLELIEKYGGKEGRSKPTSDGPDGETEHDSSKASKQRHSNIGHLPGRTTMPPPPTANIQRQDLSTPSSPHQTSLDMPSLDPMEPTAEFAPNAGAPLLDDQMASRHIQSAGFSVPPPAYEPGHWYDRIFDVLLGEDETAPKNRIVLICQKCRLVNGQAPPGTRSLVELGLWRCLSCGASNGMEKEDDGKRIVREVLQDGAEAGESAAHDAIEDETDGQPMDIIEQNIDDKSEDGPAASVRKRRGKADK